MSLLQLHVSSLSSSSSRSCSCTRMIGAAMKHRIPKLISSSLSVPKLRKTNLLEQLQKKSDDEITNTKTNEPSSFIDKEQNDDHASINSDTIVAKLWAILETVSNRIEMHENIRQQRDNWHSLLFNSINLITLSATTMVALAPSRSMGMSNFTMNSSSSLLFFAATGMLSVMNKIQPSQLVEEQRAATRLFITLRREIENFLLLGYVPTQKDVDHIMAKVLVLDRAYPLALLGAMLEKFPKKYEPSAWWPKNIFFQSSQKPSNDDHVNGRNGWSQELENEMREIINVVRTKDKEDYERLGNIALKLNKGLAISAPLLTGIATIGSAFSGFSPAAAVVAVVAAAAATVINTVEHGGQVGMVFEMYRNCGGFFELLEESTICTLEESEMENRENGEVFEIKMALKLGRSLSELKDLADKSSSGNTFDEFAGKLF